MRRARAPRQCRRPAHVPAHTRAARRPGLCGPSSKRGQAGGCADARRAREIWETRYPDLPLRDLDALRDAAAEPATLLDQLSKRREWLFGRPYLRRAHVFSATRPACRERSPPRATRSPSCASSTSRRIPRRAARRAARPRRGPRRPTQPDRVHVAGPLESVPAASRSSTSWACRRRSSRSGAGRPVPVGRRPPRDRPRVRARPAGP